MLATEYEAMKEFAWNVGDDPSYENRQWILTDYDVWVRNPHYRGPEQRHPEDDYDDEDVEFSANESKNVAEW